MSKKVSVVLPVYNVSAYLEECIRSLMEQDYQNIEIIPVNDGSKDASGQILDDLAAEDARVKPIHKENGGAASARNAGIDAATGEFICFVDSDDAVELNYISHLVESAEKEQADIAVCGFSYWSQNANKLCNGETPDGIYEGREYLARFLKDWSCSLLWNKIYRREVVGDIRMATGHRVDDEYFTYQVVMNSRKVVVTSPHLYRYRLRKSSVMQDVAKTNEPIMLDRIGYMIQRYAHIAKVVPELEEAFFRDALDNLNRYWNHSKDMPNAQKEIRRWVKAHRGRIRKLPLKQRVAVFINFYLSKPRFCGEGNPLELERDDYFL
ncbi:MAG: glycosyltransferase [Oscillospiraceae bacterium]|nr:glycosyltransferase [Oscillospiraceae bacterium]